MMRENLLNSVVEMGQETTIGNLIKINDSVPDCCQEVIWFESGNTASLKIVHCWYVCHVTLAVRVG